MTSATKRSILPSAALISVLTFAISGCDLNSDLAKRFREAYIPGLTQGLTTAATNPVNGETGLRQTLVALIDGLSSILSPKSASSTTATGS